MTALKNRVIDCFPDQEDLDLCLGLFAFLGDYPAASVELLHTQLARIAGPEAAVEVLELDNPVTGRGAVGDVHWVASGNLQLSWIYLSDIEFDAIEELARDAYSKLLAHLQSSDCSHPVRFWNFLPGINTGEGDQELYKQFCTGRFDAFKSYGIGDGQFPAASALGHYQRGFTVALLSSHTAAQHYRNPRQVDAFSYPRQYGPSSPSFARASLLLLESSALFFVSGTASIVGHESVHVNQLEPQVHTTADNIMCLLEEADFALEDINLLRVYLRSVQDKARCEAVLDERFPRVERLYLHADICRSELLVEIECICSKGR